MPKRKTMPIDPNLRERFKRVWNYKKIATIILILNLILLGGLVGLKLFFNMPSILINQVGFLPNEQKVFFIKSDFTLFNGYYQVRNESNSIVMDQQPITFLGQLWGSYYYQGDFSNWTTPGNYSIQAYVDQFAIQSVNFSISQNIYSVPLQRSYEYLYYQRSGAPIYELIPGYAGRGASDLDDYAMINGDRLSLSGGWFSDGSLEKLINSPNSIFQAIYSSLFAYQMDPNAFNNVDQYQTDGQLIPDGIPDILDEANWGIQYAEKLVMTNYSVLGSVVSPNNNHSPENDTDNINNTQDDRTLSPTDYFANPAECMWLSAACALFARIIGETGYFADENTSLTQLAQNLYTTNLQYYNSSLNSLDPSIGIPFLAASSELDLLGVSEYQTNSVWAIQLMNLWWSQNPNANSNTNEDLDQALGFIAYYAIQIQSLTSIRIAQELAQLQWQFEWLNASTDPQNFYHLIQIYSTGITPNRWDYFSTSSGINDRYLDAIFGLAMCYNVTAGAIPAMKPLLNDLIDWILGRNPDQICMIEGIGSNLPAYANQDRFSAQNPRGAVPGAIPNGYINQNNLPYLDLRPTPVGSAAISNPNQGSNTAELKQTDAFLLAFSSRDAMND